MVLTSSQHMEELAKCNDVFNSLLCFSFATSG